LFLLKGNISIDFLVKLHFEEFGPFENITDYLFVLCLTVIIAIVALSFTVVLPALSSYWQ
jgi:hypothetical protein